MSEISQTASFSSLFFPSETMHTWRQARVCVCVCVSRGAEAAVCTNKLLVSHEERQCTADERRCRSHKRRLIKIKWLLFITFTGATCATSAWRVGEDVTRDRLGVIAQLTGGVTGFPGSNAAAVETRPPRKLPNATLRDFSNCTSTKPPPPHHTHRLSTTDTGLNLMAGGGGGGMEISASPADECHHFILRLAECSGDAWERGGAITSLC